MPSDRHEPYYRHLDQDNLWDVKCTCGWIKIKLSSKSKAMKAWANHFKQRTKK